MVCLPFTLLLFLHLVLVEPEIGERKEREERRKRNRKRESSPITHLSPLVLRSFFFPLLLRRDHDKGVDHEREGLGRAFLLFSYLPSFLRVVLSPSPTAVGEQRAVAAYVLTVHAYELHLSSS